MDIVEGEANISYDDIFAYLSKMKKVFPSRQLYVVLSGGEPTINEHFEVLVNDLKHQGFKLGVHTNGIYLPRFKNPFDGVILSMKCKGDDIGFDKSDYAFILNETMNYYRDCTYKEIRIVDIETDSDWYNDLLIMTQAEEKNWEIKNVNNLKGEN
jgi:organic radical activating enzyme